MQAKRCGHRPGKALVSADEMVDRIKAAVDGRTDDQFVIMARTDAHAVEGQQAAIERALAYVEAGADMIFAEALTTLDEYRQFTAVGQGAGARQHHRVRQDAAVHGRRSSRARACSWCCIRCPHFARCRRPPRRLRRDRASEGTQKSVLDRMQTRAELYEVLGYHDYEQKLDELFAREGATSTERGVTIHGRARTMSSNETTPAAGFKPKKSVALSGVTAGNTALCTVGRSGNDLHYRGYDILDLADKCEFEEIAYLLVHGKLPNVAELARLQGEAASGCAACRRRCARRSRRCRPRATRWTCCAPACSVLGCTLPEKDDHNTAGARDIADRLMACLGSMLLLLVPLQPHGPAHRRRDRRRLDRRPLPAPAARRAAAGSRG